MKRRELLWMILPCLLLLCVGAIFSRPKSTLDENWKISIVKATTLSLSQHDKKSGYDAVVRIRAKMHDVPQDNWHEILSDKHMWNVDITWKVIAESSQGTRTILQDDGFMPANLKSQKLLLNHRKTLRETIEQELYQDTIWLKLRDLIRPGEKLVLRFSARGQQSKQGKQHKYYVIEKETPPIVQEIEIPLPVTK